jgi:hypothetical protein
MDSLTNEIFIPARTKRSYKKERTIFFFELIFFGIKPLNLKEKHFEYISPSSTFVAHLGRVIKMLDSLITSKTRLRLLVKFFINANNHGHLRGLAEEFGESTNAIRKELNHLTEAGYLKKVAVKNKISYSANIQHPLFGNLQGIVRKYVGFDTLVDQVLDRMGVVERVVVTGDYANGVDSGTISVNILGSQINKFYVKQLSRKVEGLIERKVNFTIKEAEDSSEGLILYEKNNSK